ncbi:neurogenic locus notch protein [Desmophyllum pertusum]|uniref:Neurogenic locus notch protein n=1 Tax=Desmophyllum pertusum TaxID=174260 RepID=A0A9W9Z165_9CNID|nr:neurogenic locus notch protein [Desmophyllum pertusum]
MPLHLCARFSRADAAKRLLDNRAQLGRTPLHLAVAADARDVVKTLFKIRGTDVEARMDDGATPHIIAARYDLVDIVKDLVKAGAKSLQSAHKVVNAGYPSSVCTIMGPGKFGCAPDSLSWGIKCLYVVVVTKKAPMSYVTSIPKIEYSSGLQQNFTKSANCALVVRITLTFTLVLDLTDSTWY